MKNIILIITAFTISIAGHSQNPETIDMTASQWDIPDDATFELFDGRKTLILNSGRATVKELTFNTGTIEVDVYANSQRSFAGITFRKQEKNMEEVYMRMHKSRQVDAVQYTPIFNNESNWQLYNQYQAQVTFKNEGWNTLRIEVMGNAAVVFVNEKKVMNIDHLRTENKEGQIGLFALFSNRFSNFRVTKKNIALEPAKSNTINTNYDIISEWQISDAQLFSNISSLKVQDFENYHYTTVKTEISGLLPISKHIKRTSSGSFEQNSEEYVIASKIIYADRDESKLLSFDYSDKIVVYLNGRLIFRGNNAFRAKGIQYMGHLNIDTNKLYLPLKKGKNIVQCVVIEKANGWGLIAKLE